MIGRALIGEIRLHGQGIVNREPVCVGKGPRQAALRLPALDRAVQRSQEIGRRKMNAAIRCIGRR